MTESEWLSRADLSQMVLFLDPQASDRKLRLFACACCRRVFSLLGEERAEEHLKYCEQYADGQGSREQLIECQRLLEELRDLDFQALQAALAAAAAYEASYKGSVQSYLRSAISAASAVGLSAFPQATEPIHRRLEWGKETWRQKGILLDIFGNPFRPVSFDPSWRTSTAVAIAQGMYDSRDFAAMPVLADALEDAGCNHPDILDHCRGAGPHVRGCWVVDLVLGKS